MRKFIFSLSLVIVLFSECVEPFDASVDKYENLLVIDGSITSDPGPYIVRISRSTSIDNNTFQYVPDAIVIISDDKGNSETLSEIDAGVYSTSKSGIQGVINNSYKVHIKTIDGQEYESDFQKLLPPANIKSVYGINEYQNTDDSNLLHEGYQFFVETETEAEYLLWVPIETFKYHADYKIEYYFINKEVLEYPSPDSLYTCWKTERVNDIFVLKTENNTGNNIHFPLNFVSSDTEKLSEGYSLLVKQYSIEYEAYLYWQNIKKIADQGETLYNIQPFQVEGNLKNINNPDEFILGYFLVAGLNEERIFTIPIQPTYTPYSNCVPNVMRWQNTVAYGSSDIAYAVTDENGVLGQIGGSCINCKEDGGTIIRPDFWINK